jgi:hypothetical protein
LIGIFGKLEINPKLLLKPKCHYTNILIVLGQVSPGRSPCFNHIRLSHHTRADWDPSIFGNGCLVACCGGGARLAQGLLFWGAWLNGGLIAG